MSRAKFQVLVIPYRTTANGMPEYAVTKRADMHVWQFLSGGGESGESPIQAAKREAYEEGGIPFDCEIVQLKSISSIPASNFVAHKEWGESVSEIPEYAFAVDLKHMELVLSSEHEELQWLEFEGAVTRLEWDSNKKALWELHKRITTG